MTNSETKIMEEVAQPYCIYHFEVNSIQRYVFESGRLAEMVGASDLIEDLILAKFNKTLEALEIELGPSKEAIIRQAGAAITLKLSSEEQANNLRDVWSLVVNQLAPGLLFTQSVIAEASLATALQESHDRVSKLRNQQLVSLPVAGPVIARAPRTGVAAVQMERVKAQRWELIDLPTKAKRKQQYREGRVLAERLMQGAYEKGPIRFPRNMEADEDNAFPFNSQNQYIAVIHIDGNAFGQLMINMAAKKNGQELVKKFSTDIANATRAAAHHAVNNAVIEPWLKSAASSRFPAKEKGKKLIPFRPLVLGGDDLTVITQAACAMDFVKAYIEYFESESEKALKKIKASGSPQRLTACAGVAFVKSTQPFYLAYELADSLCRFAKTRARAHQADGKPIPSALALHRITSSFIADYETALREELTANREPNVSSEPTKAKNGQVSDKQYELPQSWQLSLGAYGIGKVESSLPRWNDLQSIVKLFEDDTFNSGPLRNFLTLLHSDPEEASMAYKRWDNNMRERHPRQIKDFDQATKSLYGNSYDERALPFTRATDEQSRTFLGDLLNIYAAQGEVHGR